MLAGNYLHYFDRSVHVGDAPGLYQDIISKATTSVWIFDPYFNDGDEDYSSVCNQMLILSC